MSGNNLITKNMAGNSSITKNMAENSFSFIQAIKNKFNVEICRHVGIRLEWIHNIYG
jgi:hypothetical protein